MRAVPEAGYAFDSWTDDPSLGAERTITVGNSDATYTANFRVASKGTITGLSNNNSYGTVTVSPSGEQNGGTAVTLTPVANEGYSFSQWSDGNTDNPRTVYVDGDHTYTAQFVEGISINVQSFLFRDNAASSGWFNFQGITTGYQFVFFVNNSSVVGNYTQAHLDADNKIYDHGTELSITTASFSVTADANNYYLDGQFICSNGKRYIIHTWHEKPYGPFADDEASSGNYDGTSFSSITSNNLQSDGSYLVKANAGNPSGMSYAYQTEIDFIVDSEKQHGSEKIPSGFYFINHSGAAGTVKATNAIGYLDLNYYNDYDDIGGSYVRETYHQSGGNIGSLWIWTLNDGYARVTNVNEQYYIYVRARNSKKYTAYYTIGTAPFDVDITGDENGSVDISYYASNWGTTVHYEEGVNEFFSGNTLTLTPEAKPGYEFWRWSDEDESVENSAYGASRNVTISGNLTLQAIFRAAAVDYTITRSVGANGTLTVYNQTADEEVTFTNNAAAVADGTTLTISADGVIGYHLNTLTVGGNAFTSGSTLTLTKDTTIAATFAANAYTVSFNANGGSGDAMDAQAFTYDVAQNLSANTYTAPENMHFIGWATTAEGDVEYAAGANVSNLTATKDGSVELFAKWAYNTYTVVFNENNESAIGSMAAQAFTYGTAQNLTANGFILSGYDFAGWALTENGKIVYTNQAEVNNLTSEHEGTVTLYAQWRERFVLEDNHTSLEDDWYTTYNNKKAENKALNVTYNRTFTAGRWSTFSLPFGYSYRNDANQTFRGLVYQLVSSVYEERDNKGYLTLNCMPATTGIIANKPYILILPLERGNIVNPVFENVKLQTITENPYEVSDMNGTGTIRFINTTFRQRIDREDENENKRVIFLQSNTLHYPGGALYMSAFRGYFYMQDDYTQIYHTPARIRLVNEEGESIETLPEAAEETSVETKKYIENGILVIERAGIKYDAQGHKLN